MARVWDCRVSTPSKEGGVRRCPRLSQRWIGSWRLQSRPYLFPEVDIRTRKNLGSSNRRAGSRSFSFSRHSCFAVAMELASRRPRFCLRIFGTSGSGRATFRRQWQDSSHSLPLSEIADVDISVEVGGVNLESCDLPAADTDDDTTEHAFLLIYRPDNQESVLYALKCLQKLNSFYHKHPPKVFVLENRFEPDYLPQTSEPSQLPPLLGEGVQMTCKFWAVQLQNGTDQRVLEHVIITPVMDLLDEEMKLQLIARACSQGQLPVLQLLVGRVADSDTVDWLTCVMASLQSQSPDSPLTPDLLKVTDYLFNLDPTIFLSTVVRMTKVHPRVSLELINRFRPQGHSEDHFVKSGLALFSIPVSWFQNGNFTHIDLSNNLLLDIPEEMFRIPTLKGLNVSHNCLGSVPDILKWNCPYLRELNLSFNRLVDAKYCILNRPRDRGEPGMSDAGLPGRRDQQAHFDEARRLLRLTGYNLYPCVHSLNWVILSSNASLTQVPEWVCVLPHLTLLELRNIPKLTSLTPYLAHCRNLCVLKIDVHQLVSPPAREVVDSGTRGIMAYLRCQLRGSSPYRHLKLVLVGGNGTGKTTLFSQLARLKSHSLTSSSSSHVSRAFMELATLEYRGTSTGRERKSQKFRPKITFHLIDFASEEVFQCFHQCFLTHRTLFLCLWDTARGIDSLRSLGPWLRSIQASAPGSSVIVIGSHIDRRPALGRATIAQWEREVFGEMSGGGGTTAYPRNSGLPVVNDSVVMNCQNRRDVEKLMENVYSIALRLKHPRTRVPLVEEMVPRSYQELQTLVEVKLRGFQRKGQQVPVLRREEFVDHVRSLTLHHDSLEQDLEEFSLAVQFLHEAGTIIHYRSQVAGASELFFLSPQWLFNTLNVILTQLKSLSQNAVIQSANLPFVFQKAGIPPHFYTHFLGILEENSVVVPLDMEKGHFLIPSVLSPSPPPDYPSYDLSEESRGYLMQYVHLDYLPSGFFPRLLARVLVCVGMLSGQLLTLGRSPLIDSNHLGQVAANPRRLHKFNTVHRHFLLDRQGYMKEEEEEEGACGATSEKRLREKIWALSTTNLATWPSRHQSLMEKLTTLSRPISTAKEKPRPSNGSCTAGRRENGFETPQREREEGEEEEKEEEVTGGSRNALELVENIVWKKGLHVEFPCGTCFWLEACEGAVAMVARGEVVQRVKAIAFLSSCVDMLMEELYAGVRQIYYSPCPSCLSRYWACSQNRDKRNPGDMLPSNLTMFAESDLELSGEFTSLTLNEFKETASFARRSSGDHGNTPRSFSGSTLKLERSLSPIDDDTEEEQTLTTVNSAGEIVEEIPCVLLDNSIILYSLSSLVDKSAAGNFVRCSQCERLVALREIGPHVLLVDFSDKLLISSRELLYGEGKGSLLGEGGFGKVVKGTYEGHPVAVKLFRRHHTADSLARQYKSLREEVTILSHLDHPRVVKLMGVSLRPLCLVMDLAPQGSLANHLDLCPLGLSHGMAHRTLYQIADGIGYLHSLFIIHRDIKPGNILVWSLDPDKGVDVRLADYGVSQFSTPSGLWRQRGTEEYMAPELRESRNTAYDEKVDIFSFALLLHLVVTGRRLFAGILNRRDQLQLICHAHLPLLSHALSKSIEDNRPQSSDPSLQHVFDRTSGKHPAARRNVDASCHSTCMQPLMEHCLARNPASRPSARGVASRLLVCPGGLRQSRFFLPTPVSWARYCARENHIVAMATAESEEAVLVIPGAWLYRNKPLPYQGQRITCCAVVGGEVLMGSSASNLIFSLNLPALTSGHISPVLLPGVPLCIITQETPQGSKVVVGMSAARIAVFSPPGQGRHLLETHPFIAQVMVGASPEKTKISCGVHQRGVVWCGCGRYLLGLDSKDYSLRSYKPLLKDVESGISRIICALGQLWVSFCGRGELVVFDTSCDTHASQTIDCHLILGNCLSSEAAVTDLVSSGEAVWASTEGGHVITFDPVSGDVLLVHRRHCHASSLVCVGMDQVVVFGRERVEGVEGEEDEEKNLFTVWDSYVKHRVT